MSRRTERWLVAVGVVALVAAPWTVDGLPHGPAAVGSTVLLLAGRLGLVLWRDAPLLSVVVTGTLFLVAVFLPADPPTLTILLCTAFACVLGRSFGGRAAWTAAAGLAAWLACMYLVSGERDIGLVMLTVPGFLAGTALRLREQTANELALRGRELEEERELFTQLAVRNERARIAAELHDIIGHSLSVMVVQAAAGQRLLEHDAAHATTAADDALEAIVDSARQGREDLKRLVDLLGGEEVRGPDLSLVDEVVARAVRSGLRVTCRFEGDRDGVPAAWAEVAFRVVREALTNALRHAPGAEVRVLVRGEGRALEVLVQNDAATAATQQIPGTGQGLRGLRARVEETGGRFEAGSTAGGGWQVAARFAL